MDSEGSCFSVYFPTWTSLGFAFDLSVATSVKGTFPSSSLCQAFWLLAYFMLLKGQLTAKVCPSTRLYVSSAGSVAAWISINRKRETGSVGSGPHPNSALGRSCLVFVCLFHYKSQWYVANEDQTLQTILLWVHVNACVPCVHACGAQRPTSGITHASEYCPYNCFFS